ncbi:hypothetical protein [Xylella fastidiosa]|uniref:hypothetical protein n=1 Tax=Xylella fastidiosa TaxID=2371 RepID=UPI0013E374A0|nr:hypothetical protein [Xylella fastidiosa]
MKKQEISQRRKVDSLQLSRVEFVSKSEIDSNRKLMAPELDLTQIRGRYFKQRVLVAAIRFDLHTNDVKIGLRGNGD